MPPKDWRVERPRSDFPPRASARHTAQGGGEERREAGERLLKIERCTGWIKVTGRRLESDFLGFRHPVERDQVLELLRAVSLQLVRERPLCHHKGAPTPLPVRQRRTREVSDLAAQREAVNRGLTAVLAAVSWIMRRIHVTQRHCTPGLKKDLDNGK